MCADLVDALSRRGHHIAVVSTENGHMDGLYAIEQKNSCAVCRVKSGKIDEGGLPLRAFANIRLNNKVAKAVKEAFPKERFDLIYYEAPPVTVSNALLQLKEYYGARLFVFVREFSRKAPAISDCCRKNRLLTGIFERAEEALYRGGHARPCLSRRKALSVRHVSIYRPR